MAHQIADAVVLAFMSGWKLKPDHQAINTPTSLYLVLGTGYSDKKVFQSEYLVDRRLQRDTF